MQYLLGIDVGSTTVKMVLMGDGKTLYQKYERHYSQVREKTAELLSEKETLLYSDIKALRESVNVVETSV